MRSDAILWVLAQAFSRLLSNPTHAEDTKLYDTLLGASYVDGTEISENF